MIDQRTYALFAAVFALITVVGLLALGNDLARKLTLFATLLGCFSQFAAQDTRSIGKISSIVAAYIAFATILAAIIFL